MFAFGTVSLAQTAAESLNSADVELALQRHRVGDLGRTTRKERQGNEDALEHCELLSSYCDRIGKAFLVITRAIAWDTTVSLKADY
jgi:hypothetical protein